MLNKLRILNLIRNIESIRGTRPMKSVLPTIGLRFKKSLDLKRGFLTKFFQCFLWQKIKMFNPKSQKSSSGNLPSDKPTCAKCDKKHWGECLVWKRNYIGCGRKGHKFKDCPYVRIQENWSSIKSS